MADDPPADSAVLSTHQPAVTQPLVSDLDSLNQGVAERGVSSPGEELFVIDDCQQWQQLSDLQLNKVYTFILAISLISLMLSELVKLYLCNVLFYNLKQTHDQPKQETFSLDKAIMNLQTELHKVQTEKDVLSDLR